MSNKRKIQLVIYRSNPSMEVLLLHYAPPRSYWENLTANVEDEECDLDCIHRELMEECGIAEDSLLEMISLGTVNFQKSGLTYREDVYAVKVKDPIRIDISCNPDMEHDRFKWVKPPQAMELLNWDHMKESVAKLAYMCFEPISS